jgi:hypothetical protein
MKKIFLGLIFVFSLTSCSKYEKNGDVYNFVTKQKDGSFKESKVKFEISKEIIDSLKLTDKEVKEITDNSVMESKASLKNTLSFEFLPETETFGKIKIDYNDFLQDVRPLNVDTLKFSERQISQIKKQAYIMVGTEFIGQNGFGVKGSVTRFLFYDIKSHKLVYKL